MGHHLKAGVLEGLPPEFASLVQQSNASEGHDMLSAPDLDRHVFVRVLEDRGAVDLDPDGSAHNHCLSPFHACTMGASALLHWFQHASLCWGVSRASLSALGRWECSCSWGKGGEAREIRGGFATWLHANVGDAVLPRTVTGCHHQSTGGKGVKAWNGHALCAFCAGMTSWSW